MFNSWKLLKALNSMNVWKRTSNVKNKHKIAICNLKYITRKPNIKLNVYTQNDKTESSNFL